MSQTIVKETVCGNKQFRACVEENHKCMNCGKLFIDTIKKGEWITYKCWSCREVKNIEVQYIWSGSQIEGRCQECMALDKVINPLLDEFVGACETHHDKSNDEITAIEEKALDKIIKLPKAQLKELLRRMNSSIER